MSKRKPVHLKENDFGIKKSTIKNAGHGLFSKKQLIKGDTVGPYLGKVLTDEQTGQEPYINSDYILWVCKDHNICGAGELGNYTRYINHGEKPNAQIVTSTRWKKARIEVVKRIKPNEEIFIDYGPDYWDYV